MLDVRLDYEIQREGVALSIRPRFARLGQRVVTALRFLQPARAWCALSSSPAIRVWSGSIRDGTRPPFGSSRLGFWHILDGTDHLLFLLCLVIPFRRLRGASSWSSRRSPPPTRSR